MGHEREGSAERGQAPSPPPTADPAAVVAALLALRSWAGAPSFTEIARRVTSARVAKGVPREEARLARSTAYDLFRHGRRRVEIDLVVEVVRALSGDPILARRWRETLASTRDGGHQSAPSVQVRAGLPRMDGIVGRDDDIDRVLGSRGTTVITGMAGIGKTTVAFAAARSLVESGTVDQVLVAQLDGVGASGDRAGGDALREAIADELGGITGIPRRPGETAEGWCARILSSTRIALVLDNAADPDDVVTLTPRTSSSRVIITSRQRSGTARLHEITLRELDQSSAAVVLATESAGALPRDEASTIGLAEALGGLPLALVLVGRRAASAPGWSPADHLEAHTRRTALLHLDEPVAEVIRQSYDVQPAQARLVLRLAGTAPGTDVSTESLAALAGRDPRDVERDVRSLTEGHLLRPSGPGRWELHDLVRVFARARSALEDAPSAVVAAHRRLLEHQVATASRHVASTHPHEVGSWWWAAPEAHGDRELALTWLLAERASIIASALAAAELGCPELGAAAAALLVPYLWDRSEPSRVLELARHGLVLARSAGTARGEAVLERLVGRTCIRAGDYEQAREHLARSLLMALEEDAQHDVAMAHNGLALIASADGDVARAVEHSELALAYFREHPEDGFVCGVLNNLAVYHFEAGKPGESLAVFEEVVELAVEHGWLTREQWALSNMSEILVGLGRLDEAAAAVDRAGALAVRLDDAVGHAYVLSSEAIVLHGRGDTPAAIRTTEECIRRARALGHPSLEASALSSLGGYQHAIGRDEEAAASYREALAIATRIGESPEVDRATAGLAGLGLDP